MGASPHSLKPLLVQAVGLVEEFHVNKPAQAQSTRSGWQLEATVGTSWLKHSDSRDLAARVALGLALKTKATVGYLAVGECALHAMMRIWLLAAGVDASRVLAGEIAEEEFPRLTMAAERIANARLVLSDRDVPKKKIQQATRQFIEDSQLEYLVVDEPDVETLRDPTLFPEQEHWRIRMEFREAVRGTNVMMILPG